MSQLWNVAYSQLRMTYRYRLNLINLFVYPVSFFIASIAFSGILEPDRFAITAGGTVQLVAYAMVGLGLYSLTTAALGSTGSIEGEVARGTISANLVTPMSPIAYVGGICAANLIAGTAITVVLAAVGIAAGGARTAVSAELVLAFTLSMLLYFGLSLCVAAVALKAKRASAFIASLSVILQFLIGAVVPVRSLPAALSAIAIALPPTWALDAVRAQLLGIEPLAAWPTEFGVLAAQAAVAIAAGMSFVGLACRSLRTHGGIDVY